MNHNNPVIRDNQKEENKLHTEQKTNNPNGNQNSLIENDRRIKTPSLKSVYSIQNSNIYFNNIIPNIQMNHNDQHNEIINNNQIYEEINTDINMHKEIGRNQNQGMNMNNLPLFDRIRNRINRDNLIPNIISNNMIDNTHNNNIINNIENIPRYNQNNNMNELPRINQLENSNNNLNPPNRRLFSILKADKDNNVNNQSNNQNENLNNSLIDSNYFRLPKNQVFNNSNNIERNNHLINLNDNVVNNNNTNRRNRIGRHNNYFGLLDNDNESMRNIEDRNNIDMDKSLSIDSNSVMDIDRFNNMNDPKVNSRDIDAKESTTEVEISIYKYKFLQRRKKATRGYTHKIASLFLTYIGDYNNNGKHHQLFEYFSNIVGYAFTYVVKDRIPRRNNKCKYHYYTEFKEGTEFKLDELGDVEIYELNISGKKVKQYMLENGQFVFEDGFPLEKGVLSIDKIKEMQPAQRNKLSVYYYGHVEKLNRLDNNQYVNCKPYKDIDAYYIQVNTEEERDEALDMIYTYLSGLNVPYDLITYVNKFWFGISGEDTPIAVYRDFWDYQVPFPVFFSLIDRYKDEMDIKGGVRKNLYSKVIIVSKQRVQDLYYNIEQKYNLAKYMQVYSFSQLNDIGDLNSIFRIVNRLLV